GTPLMGQVFSGDHRSNSLEYQASSRVNYGFTVDTDEGSSRTNFLYSDQTINTTTGDVATGVPYEGAISTISNNLGVSTNRSYVGLNPLTPVLGMVGMGPKIDVAVDVNVSGGKKGDDTVTFTGSVSGDDYPNTEFFVTDRFGNPLALGYDVRGKSPFNLFGDATEGLFNFNVTIELNQDGSFGNIITYKDADGNTQTTTLGEWNAQFLETDVDTSQR
ncbi:MAG: hypothetical protein AAFY76_15140, partial [Cyanobacteria bacterium J06649_11]